MILNGFCFKDPPGKPGKPEPTTTNKTSISLKWTEPTTDGGSPIKGYVVEKKEKGDTRWTKVNREPEPDCNMKVTGLIHNTTYEFRVMAVNAAGPSEPSSNSSPIVAREAICKLFKTFSYQIFYLVSKITFRRFGTTRGLAS